MKALGILITIIATLVISTIWNGFVLSKIWGWFAVSTFSLPTINLTQAMGLSLIASFLTHQHDKGESKYKSETDKVLFSLYLTVITPAFILLIGWIVTLFM